MFMKNMRIKILIFLSFFIISVSSTSCSKKSYGCPGEKAGIKMDKNGNLPTKRGKSHLFNRETRRRIKKHNRK